MSKKDIADFVKRTSLDEKLKTVALNKNKLNELSKKLKWISTKGLPKDLINKFRILNGAKYFFSNISKLFSVFTSQQPKSTLNILVEKLRLNC